MNSIRFTHIVRNIALPLAFWAFGSVAVWGQAAARSAEQIQVEAEAALEAGNLAAAVVAFTECQAQFFAEGDLEASVNCAMGHAIARVYRGEFDRALAGLKAARDQLLAADAYPEGAYADLLDLYGTVYSYVGDNERALAILLEAEALNRQSEEDRTADLANIYHNIGAIYFERNDYDRAIEYERSARKSFREAGMEQDYAETGINLGLALLRRGDHREALFVLEESAQQADIADLEPAQQAGLYLNLGLVHLELREWEACIAASGQILTRPRMRREYVAIARGNIGLARLQQGQIAPARQALRRAVAEMDSLERPSRDEFAKLCLHLAQAYRAGGEPDSALVTVERGIRRQLELGGSVGLDTLGDLTRPCNRRTLLRLLAERADLLDAQGAPMAALGGYRQAFGVIDLLRNTFFAERSKQFLGAYVLPIYEKSLDLTWRQYAENRDSQLLEEALLIAERNKAVLLLESMQEAQLVQGGFLQDSLISADRDLQRDLDWYEAKRYAAEKSGDSARIDLYEGYLIEKQAAADRVEAALKKRYPSYLKRRQAATALTLAEVQDYAQRSGAAVLEYFSGERYNYALLIRADAARFFRLERLPREREIIARYRRALSDWSYILGQPEEVALEVHEYGRALFRALLEPVFGADLPERLLLISDGRLGFIPFETLLEDDSGVPGEYLTLPYLLRRCEIGYAYSLALTVREKAIAGAEGLPRAIAFAPEYLTDTVRAIPKMATRAGEAALPGAQAEVAAIAEYFATVPFVGDSATESYFKQVEGGNIVLHLAMHGVLDNAQADFSYLAFAPGAEDDGHLHAWEVEQLVLPARLVVLSACETGTGQLLEGEGVMSLARGFLNAGAESVVMSLWKLEDYATAEISRTLYRGLAEGQGKTAALRTAKLAYLEEADDLTAHPAFWAGLILIGDQNPLAAPGPGKWLYGLLGGLGLALIAAGGWYWRRRRRG
ncbi:MAG: CHAT domain-containing tetratricopeptide repeat protein [Bacteroidota bacterium]